VGENRILLYLGKKNILGFFLLRGKLGRSARKFIVKVAIFCRKIEKEHKNMPGSKRAGTVWNS